MQMFELGIWKTFIKRCNLDDSSQIEIKLPFSDHS